MNYQWSDLARREKEVILRHYHALEQVDGKKDFQECARLLQSLWREEQGFPP